MAQDQPQAIRDYAELVEELRDYDAKIQRRDDLRKELAESFGVSEDAVDNLVESFAAALGTKRGRRGSSRRGRSAGGLNLTTTRKDSLDKLAKRGASLGEARTELGEIDEKDARDLIRRYEKVELAGGGEIRVAETVKS